MNLHEAALTNIIGLARQRGSVTMEDLRKALPVNSMTEEELAHVLARLDEAGFDVEINPTLVLAGDKKAVQYPAPGAKRAAAEPPKPKPEERRQPTGLPASSGEPTLKNRDQPRAGSSTAASIYPWLIAFAIILVVVFIAVVV
jgi:hypothetical protein